MNSSLSNVGYERTAAGMMFGILATAALVSQPTEVPNHSAVEKRIWTKGESATVGNVNASLSRHFSIIDQSLVTEVAETYARFAASQKPLDPEFARLLSANLWDLYAR